MVVMATHRLVTVMTVVILIKEQENGEKTASSATPAKLHIYF